MEGATNLPDHLKKILDRGAVAFAPASNPGVKRNYDRTALSFETRFIRVAASPVEPAATATAPAASAPVKEHATHEFGYGALPKPATAAPATPRLAPPVQEPGASSENSGQTQRDQSNPPVRRGQSEERAEPTRSPLDSPPTSDRAMDTPAAPAPAAAGGRDNPERVSSPEISRPQPADSEPVRHDVQPPRTAAARDIRLELSSGERRVEVRLSERAGELHVAVRTPDERLSGALRENLPTLSSRLEQAGFRSETAAAAMAPASRTPVEHGAATANSNLADGRESNQGQNQSHHQERRQQQSPSRPEEEQQPNRKQKGQDFAWLVSSLT